jgi:hypothetical protein
MNTQTASGNPVNLQQVIEVLKTLPADKLSSAYDYLRFLQQQSEAARWPFDASPAEMQADDDEWDNQLGAEASQRFLSHAAATVRAEITAKQTSPLIDLLDEEDMQDEAGKREISH